MAEDYNAMVDDEVQTLREEAEWHAMFGGDEAPEDELVNILAW